MIHLAVAIVSFFVVFTAGCMLLGALCRLLNGAQRAVKAIAREVMAPVHPSLPPLPRRRVPDVTQWSNDARPWYEQSASLNRYP